MLIYCFFGSNKKTEILNNLVSLKAWRCNEERHSTVYCIFFSFLRKGHWKHPTSLFFLAQNPLCPLGWSTPALLSTCHFFFQIKEFLIKIRKDWSFLLIPWSVQVTEPLEPREQTGADVPQLRSIVAAPRSHLWVPPLLEAADCFSFWISGRVLARGFRMGIGACHEHLAWAPPPPPPHRPFPYCPPHFQLCDPRAAKVRGLTCMRERAQYLRNI